MSQTGFNNYDRELIQEEDYEIKSKEEDERHYRKYLVLAIVIHLINVVATIGFSVMPFQIKSTSGNSHLYMSSFLILKDSKIYNLYQCVDFKGEDQCNLDFPSAQVEEVDIKRFRSLSIFVSFDMNLNSIFADYLSIHFSFWCLC